MLSHCLWAEWSTFTSSLSNSYSLIINFRPNVVLLYYSPTVTRFYLVGNRKMVEKLVKQLNKQQTGDSSKNAGASFDGCIFTCEISDFPQRMKLLEFPPLSLLYLQTSIMVWIYQNNNYTEANTSDRMGLHVLTNKFSWIGTKEVCHYTYKIPGAGKYKINYYTG